MPFRSLIKCGECESTWIPYTRTKALADGTQALYDYIKCNRDRIKRKCDQKQLSIKELEKQVIALLDQITVSEDFCNWAIEWIKNEHKTESDAQMAILKNLEAFLEGIQTRRSRLVEMYMDGLMDDQSEYKERKAKLAEEEAQTKKDLEKLKARTLNWMDLAIKTFNFAKNAKYHFEHGSYEDKTLILRALGSNFYILDGKLCVDLIKPFLIFKEHQLDVQASFETIELPEFAMVGANNSDFEHWFIKWSG